MKNIPSEKNPHSNCKDIFVHSLFLEYEKVYTKEMSPPGVNLSNSPDLSSSYFHWKRLFQ